MQLFKIFCLQSEDWKHFYFTHRICYPEKKLRIRFLIKGREEMLIPNTYFSGSCGVRLIIACWDFVCFKVTSIDVTVASLALWMTDIDFAAINFRAHLKQCFSGICDWIFSWNYFFDLCLGKSLLAEFNSNFFSVIFCCSKIPIVWFLEVRFLYSYMM